MKLPAIYDVVVSRHTIYHTNQDSFLLVTIMLLTTTYKSIISLIFLICVTMYPYARTRPELGGYITL